jgi:hypothetical protein
MKKRASIFVMDFIVAISLLFAFFIYIKPYMAPTMSYVPILRNYAEQSTTYLRELPMDVVEEGTIGIIPEEYLCMDCLMSEQLALLMLKDKVIAGKVANLTLADFIPHKYGFGVALMGEDYEDFIELREGDTTDNLMAQTTLVSRLGKDEGINKLYLLQVRVWG